MSKRKIEDAYPLSPMQQGMLFHSLYAPNTGIYVSSHAWLLERLDESAFERAWHKVLDRHPILRTAFSWKNSDQPLQAVLSRVKVPLERQSWKGMPQAEFETRLKAYLQADQVRGFELNRAPLMRLTLIELDGDDYELVWSCHHLIMDGWSQPMVLKEVLAFYEAFSQGRDLDLPPTCPYSDYIAWLQQQDLSQAETFWRETLKGFTTPTPINVPSPARAGSEPEESWGEYRMRLSAATTAKLQSLASRNHLTLNILAQGAWALLLSRYSGASDIVFGAVLSGRSADLAGVESMVGNFINTLPVRVKICPDWTLLDWLKQLQQRQVEMLQYEYSPLAQVQSWSDAPHGSRLFDSILAFQNYHLDPIIQSEAVNSRAARLHASERTNYPLTLVVAPATELAVRFDFDSRQFDRPTIVRLAGHFRTLLEGFADNPRERLSLLPMLTEAEQLHLLSGPKTDELFPVHACPHQLFEAQAERSPDNVAIVSEHGSITYRELNERANQLSRYLTQQGVGPDNLVALYFDRSIELIVAILGTLKAGAAYIPLDPAYPRQRIKFVLEDTGAPMLLSEKSLLDAIPDCAARVICLDADWPIIARQSRRNLLLQVSGDALAYVIYTSGSTGAPKGVGVSHSNVARLFEATRDYFHFNHQDVWTLFHSYAFDFSCWELWGALLYGGRLAIVPYWITRSPDTFLKLVREERVTVLNQTPSAFRQFIQADSAARGDDLALRFVIFGGEALDLLSLEPWFERHSDEEVQVVNMYGITETTVHVTYRLIKSSDVRDAHGSRIGVPIPDLQIYLFDNYLNPVPFGVSGQIYVGGSGLGRGYLNRPDLTADRFIPNPFSRQPGARLYRAGDLARRLPDHDLEYLGRIDHQVKVRGFRIELGEIEAALRQHSGVLDALALVREDTPAQKRLVAYVVVKDSKSATAGQLRQFLQERLPEFIIPSAFVTIDSFPLTPNGKLDRAALPAPGGARPELSQSFAPPQNEQERLLAETWSDVLGIDQIGALDNFFALGGDSIRSIQVLYKAQQKGLRLTFDQLFRHQTVRAIVENLRDEGESSIPPSHLEPFSLVLPEDRNRLPAELEDAYPLTALQVGMIFHSEYGESAATYHDVFSYHLQIPFNEGALRQAAQDIIDRHPILRTSFDLTSFGEPLQLVRRALPLPLECFDWRGLDEHQQETMVEEWVEKEKVRAFDWKQAPLLRFQVHRRSQQSIQFTVSFHHSIIDGWSLATMLTELFRRYFYLLGKEVDPLAPPPKTTYRDFVRLERESLDSADARRYWDDKLSDPNTARLPRWPLKADDGQPQPRRVQEMSVPISDEVSDGLTRLAQVAAVPLKSVCLAAHLSVLSLLTGQSDVITGLVSNGRPEDSDGERIVGLFLNTLPFRQQLRGGAWIDLVKEAFTTEREMLPFRRYPLARLRGASELFETAFNYVHFHVYQGMEGFDGIRVLGGRGFEETNFTLMVSFAQAVSSSRMQLNLNYDATQLSEEQMKAMREYYARSLAAIAANPEDRYDLTTLLSEPEQRQLLIEWNNTEVEYPLDRCLHNWVEDQVERTPDAVAVVFQDQLLTYRELNCRANQLAHYLRSAGVGADSRVAICMERSLEMVIALLGSLKAGAGYLPLDPTSPKERLSFILEDAKASMLLTQPRLLAALPPHGARMLALSDDWEAMARNKPDNPVHVMSPDNAAYVIFTSGSTGRPKGVVIPHRGICNRLMWMQSAYEMGQSDAVIQKTPYDFDVSVWEFFWPLMNGARLVVAQPEGHKDSQYLMDLTIERQITTLHFVPPMLEAFLGESGLDGCRSLKQVFCSGEALSYELQEKFYAKLDAELHNLYGPTEASVEVTFWPCQREGKRKIVPIGWPISNTRTYIFNGPQQLLPAGTAGELHLAGTGLARGYLNRPDLTANAFRPDPFSGESGARLYKTGDLARYLPEGSIEYLGRLDHQVKIRGFRIELGEIQSALLEHKSVRQAVVVVRADEHVDKRLVAYLAMDREAASPLTELTAFLKEKLPEYMVPSAFVVVDEIPLTSNGKLDRKALPAPEAVRLGSSRAYTAPRNQVEELLVEIWAWVLRLDQVGVFDNFFDLGGHSLLATQLVSRIRETFKVKMPLRTLFESPTIAELAAIIENEKRSGRIWQLETILPAPRDRRLPLSFAQQRLWFLDQLTPNNPFYNISGAVRLEGRLDLEALGRVINEIVRRHEVLRTRFEAEEGQPAQVIDEWTPRKLEVEDLTNLTPEEREQEVRRMAGEEAGTGFDLARGPLLRVKGLKLGEEEHVLLYTMHHIVSDGWSSEILRREVGALYQAYSAGEPSPLEELPIQYADFAVWQRRRLQGETLERELEYWREQLSGMEDLELPLDRPRLAAQSFRGAIRHFVVEKAAAEKLRELSRREGASLFMTLLGGFNVLMSRYSGQRDIAIGTDIANRNRAEIEGLIGFFVNQLVLRVEVRGEERFSELLKRVRESCLGAYAHQDLPFEKLVEELHPERDPGRSPLFQTKLILQNAPREGVELRGLGLSSIGGEIETTRLDLTVSIMDTGSELAGAVTYSLDLFEEETIERLMSHYTNALRGIAEAERPIRELNLLSDREREQILVEWNETRRPYPQERCIHELFAEQAKRTPDRIALICEQRQVSYRELDRRANQLAHYLEGLGVGPEVVVGLCLKRSVEMVVGLIGALKAGGAYLPLDPTIPLERCAFMLEDAGVGVTLTEQKLEERLPSFWGQTVLMDKDWERIGEQSESEPASGVGPGNLAYVIYTSGSTGRPKGVMITHGGLANYLNWASEAYGIEEGEGAPVQSSIGFDLTVTSLYGPLVNGKRVILLPEEEGVDGLARALREERGYSLVKLTPSHLELLASQMEDDDVEGRTRALVIGGEQLKSRELEYWRRRAQGTKLINEYGPTETVVGCCVYEVKDAEFVREAAPIGKPIANTQIYIIDEGTDPTPIGGRGEIAISGAGLARGYLGRPDLTAERFIPNPFSRRGGERAYRTGDVGRCLSDGNLEFIGRADDQVKIRGYRIELGEIQAVLNQHRAVKQSVVVAAESERGDRRLVGYVVGEEANGPEIEQYLRERLPEYMAPEAIVTLKELPLTANGKVDKKRLPSLKDVGRRSVEEYAGNQTPIEELVIGIFEEVLKLDRVGIEDNFFEVGGHSLLATQVVSRVRNTFGVEIGVGSIFEKPTVRGLASWIEDEMRAGRQDQAPPLARVPRDRNLPLSFAQQRLWFMEQLEPESAVFNIPAAARFAGPLDLEALERSFNEIARRHESLRTTFKSIDGQPAQIIAPPQHFDLPVVDLSEALVEAREKEAQRLIIEEAQRPFDIVRGPLMRASALRLDADDHIILFTTHHIISDGWSTGIIEREMTALYEAFSAGRPSPLEDLPIQYADFAHWQRQWLQGEDLESHLAYWRQKLGGEIPTLDLPVDRPHSAIQDFRVKSKSMFLPKELSGKILAMSRQENCTLTMTLVAAFNLFLARLSGSSDVITGMTIANRTQSEIENLIGFFVNTLPLRIDLSGSPSFRHLMRGVREISLGAYAHQDLPFEKLVEEIQPERDLSRHPLFDVLINNVNTPNNSNRTTNIERRDATGIRQRALEQVKLEWHFALTLNIMESADEIGLALFYRLALFSDERINLLLEQFRYLLEQIVSAPHNSIDSYSLLTPGSKRLLPDASLSLPEPHYVPVTKLFSDWAMREPQLPALGQNGSTWTYGELAEKSDALARILLAEGLQSGDVVAVIGSRNFGLMTAIIAVFSSRGVLLTVSKDLPPDRQRLLLEQAGAKRLIYVGDARPDDEWIAQRGAIPVTFLDQSSGIAVGVEAGPDMPVLSLPEILPDDPAYIVFTSGTTGVPKGVVGRHKGLSHFVSWQRNEFQVGPQDRIPQLATLSVDVIFRESFLALTSGACLYLLSESDDLGADKILPMLERERITILHTVPAVLQSWLAGVKSGAGSNWLRWIFLVGEPLSSSLVKRWREAFPHSGPIVNLYGSTETNLAKSFYVVPDEMVEGTQPAGFPLPQSEALVLANGTRLCGIGELGEIAFRTPFLSLGYLNAHEENAKRFVRNPFRNDERDKIYLMGDKGRYRLDGSLEVLGRLDDQIKIRGMRVEPVEVEMALRQHPDVNAVAVLAGEDEYGDSCLRAYLAPNLNRASVIAGRERYKLPNNMAVTHLNRDETDFLYREIFQLQAYLRHGITIEDDSCVFDVGANIGLFTLFISQFGENLKLYAFEPNPRAFEVLSLNTSLYGKNARVFNFGLSDRIIQSTFTFFPKSSLLSGLYADAEAEKETTRTYMMNQLKVGMANTTELLELADEILAERFASERFTVPVRTLSSVIEEEGLDRIDLLKINVEKSELDVLSGLNDADWGKIAQIVLEVDVKENMDPILSLLAGRGYELAIHQDELLVDTPLCYIYAIRPDGRRKLLKDQAPESHLRPVPVLSDPLLSAGELRQFLSRRLPDYMLPSAFNLLDVLPLTAGGKVDRAALARVDQNGHGSDRPFVGPRNHIEEMLMNFWAEVLQRDRISVFDNFFDLGGHSLIATRVMSRLRNAFQVELSLRRMFEAPTIAGLARMIQAQMKAGHLSDAPPIKPVSRLRRLPLSFAQQRLWFLYQWDPDSPAYNMTAAVRLSGRLKAEALERSVNKIIERHEALRTTFTMVDGEPVQIIVPAMSLSLPVTDLSRLPVDERNAEAVRLTTREAHEKFDLERGPLMRMSLLRLGPEDHVVALTMHHIISDGWSMGVLIREMATLYEAFCEGLPSPLEDLPIQYADFAYWQRQWLQGEVLEEQLRYWSRQLEGCPPALSLFTDRPRQMMHSWRGATQSFALPKDLSGAIEALARRDGATLFVMLLAAFQVLLHRYTGGTDFSVGTPIAGRDRLEIEELIGFFVNTLVMRADLSGDPRFEDALARALRTVLDANAHQDLPFETLVERLQPDRDLSHTPLFQVMFVFQNAPKATLRLPGLKLNWFNVETNTAKYDLTLALVEGSNGLYGTIEYKTDLFDSSTIERMLGHFQALLEGIVADPRRRISELPLLAEAERRQLLVERKWAEADYSSLLCVHELFEAQVKNRPDAVAAVLGEEELSYEQLNGRANKLARLLRRKGVGADQLVAIFMDRSLEMVVAVIGALKAGGAYVPIDPAYPKQRISFALQDSGASVLLSQQSLLERLPDHDGEIICLDSDWPVIAEQDSHDLVNVVSPDNLAYVIYTSGSTGNPKGAQITHSNVTRLFSATDEWFNAGPDDVWTLFHSYAFDFSVWELWGALLYGGRLVVAPYLVSRSPEVFYDMVCAERVTIVNQTPSAFRQFIQADSSAGADVALALRLVIFGGEALDFQSLRPWFDRRADEAPRMVNMYGITETTVHVTYRQVKALDLGQVPGSMVGEAMADLQMYIVDRSLQIAPRGLPGEIYVGGAGLARGYLNRPDLTASRFLPNPFSSRPGARLYQTGDLGRDTSNRDIQHLGRIDNQVKIRGFRIELGEIESVIRLHPDIREVAALAREDGLGEKRLIAYFVSSPGADVGVGELRAFLKDRLPEYMTPSAFLKLPSLPLTNNGKLDHAALPMPGAVRPNLDEAYEGPRTPEERALAEIWAGVLGLQQVGVNDNFFALGGDSIRSIQARSFAKQRGLDFTLQQLFQHQTIRELAQNLKRTDETGAVALRDKAFSLITEEDRRRMPDGVEDAYPLARLQVGMLFHGEYASDSVTYHDALSFYLKAPFDMQALQAAIQGLTRRHPMLRTSFDLTNFSEPLQLAHSTVDEPLEVSDLRELSDDEQERVVDAWIEEEKRRRFDYGRAPLLRFHVHRRSEETFQFSLGFHHAILDGWSVATMLTELFQSYRTIMSKRDDWLIGQPLSVSFRDFIAQERAAMASDLSRNYWLDKLEDLTVSTLPRWPGREPKIQPGGRVRMMAVPIGAEVSEGLKRLSQMTGAPLKSVLLAAHLKALSMLSGQMDVVTGMVSNGRLEEADGESVLGLFLNTLPLRVKLRAGGWADLVRQTFEAEREMMPHRRYPLAELQKIKGGGALFEAAFNYLHFHVYQGISNFDEIQVLGSKVFEETSLTFIATFGQSLDGSQVQLTLNYDSSELNDEQLEAIGGYYARALEAMGARPSERFDLVSLLSEEETRRQFVAWNSTQRPLSRDDTVHRMFEEQVERTPDRIAVESESNCVTYSQLNGRANQMARYLASEGVRAGTLVGICCERSIDMVVALLGVLKAGGAYAPLDPDYPAERLTYMVEDSRTPVLLTEQRWVERLPAQRSKVVCLDRDREEIARFDHSNPNLEVGGDQPAYVIYTSGSTGQPKGVMISHRSLANQMRWMCETFPLTSQDRLLQKTPFSFDASIWEFYAPLLSGAQLVMARPEGHKDAGYLVKAITERNIHTIQLVPSLLRVLLDEDLSTCRGLKRVFCGGEALTVDIQERFFASGLEAELHNLYGPTETTVQVTYSTSDRARRPISSIGRPIHNTQIYILDSRLNPAAIGVAGELCVGGESLGHGYLNWPELTAERFIPDPFSHHPGSRLYKTEDLARFGPDGQIEYLGRLDDQIKFRGYRVELGEIEAVVSRRAGIKAAAVAFKTDATGGQRLIGYFIPDPEAAISADDLRDYLKDRVPEYMVPSTFVALDELPRTPSGKIDRKALPALCALPPGAERSFDPPRTQTEEIVAGFYSRLLGGEAVGSNDNFFDLGGNSLLATQMVSRLRNVFQAELPLRWLFMYPTVKALALQIDNLMRSERGLELAPINPAPRDIPLPLSFAQQQLWFLDQLEPNSSAYNMAAAVRLHGALNVDALQRAFSEIKRRHESLRTTFSFSDGQPWQIVSPPTHFELPVEDLSHLPDDGRESRLSDIASAEAMRPFDLAGGPLMRSKLLKLADGDHALVLVMHHIISDGWSMGVFIREMTTLYESFLRGEPSPLAELPIQYADYAHWQRRYIQGEVLERELGFWRERLAGDIVPVALPADRPRPPVRTDRGGQLNRQLSPELSEALKSLSRAQGATLYMTLLAAFKTLLYRYSGQQDLVVGAAVTGRNRLEAEDLIGNFINTLPLRSSLSGTLSFRAFLSQVRDMTLATFSHQDLPLQKIVEELQPERQHDRTPLFQVAFGLQQAPTQTASVSGLTLTPMALELDTVRLDLTAWMLDTPNGIGASYTYSSDLFEASTIERMHAHLERLLESIIANPEEELSLLEMRTEEELRQQAKEGSERLQYEYQKLMSRKPKTRKKPVEHG